MPEALVFVYLDPWDTLSEKLLELGLSGDYSELTFLTFGSKLT